MDCSNQDQNSIFLQVYRRVVTVIRQEDIGIDVHDKRYPMPFMCGSSHMPRKEEGSAHKRTKPQTPAPKGDTSLADERVKGGQRDPSVVSGDRQSNVRCNMPVFLLKPR